MHHTSKIIMPVTQSKYAAIPLYEELDTHTHTLFLNKFLKILEGSCAGVRAFFVLIGAEYSLIGTKYSLIGTQHCMNGAKYSIIGTKHSINDAQHSMMGAKQPIIGTDYWLKCAKFH